MGEIKDLLQDIKESLRLMRITVDEEKEIQNDIMGAVKDMKIRVESLTISGIEITIGGKKDE